MRCNSARRLALVAAWFAVSCGGKAHETRERTGAELCAEAQQDADAALQRLVNANNACSADADCTSVEGLGECYTYCVVPVRRSNVRAVTDGGRDLCRAYVEDGCSISFACPNSPGVACIAGRCTFKF
jgi:hypothetical protein